MSVRGLPPSTPEPQEGESKPVEKKKQGEGFIAGIKHKITVLKKGSGKLAEKIKATLGQKDEVSQPVLNTQKTKGPLGVPLKEFQKRQQEASMPENWQEVKVENDEENEVPAPPNLGTQKPSSPPPRPADSTKPPQPRFGEPLPPGPGKKE